MAGRTKNVNLNKEPFEGRVRHWRRQWVPYGDKTKENKGAWMLRLIKWVPTDQRSSGSKVRRHSHIAPVTDVSLVPGGRISGQTAAAGATAAAAAGVTAAAAGQQPHAPTAAQQQQQQQQGGPAAAAAPHEANQQQQYSGPSASAGAAAADGDAQQQQQQLPRVTSLNALSIDVSASQQDAATAAAAAAAGASGPPSFVLPSPSGVTGGAFSYSHLSVGQLQLQTTGSDFANYAAGAPSAGGAASGYTAGTERTDSDALGRLPHAGGPAASTGYTDSMDVDIDGAGGASQGGVSQQQQGGSGGVSLVAGSMDTTDEDGDAEGDEEAEGDEDDQEEEEEDVDDDEGEEEEEEEDDGYADDGLEDDGLGDVGGDMP